MKIIYNNKEYDLTGICNLKYIKEKDYLKIKLKGINNVTDLSSMFEGCSQLSCLSNLSQLDTTYVNLMTSLFKDCKFLELPDISNWNTDNVVDMSYMFQGCSLLKSLPDISNWNTSNVGQMFDMFSGCFSLKSLPDISKWDITLSLAFENISGIFDGCSKSLNIPDKFKNVK